MRQEAERLRAEEGVEQVVAFGNTLHVSGRDPERLLAAVERHRAPGLRWRPVESSLEDVFIGLMDTSRDNVA